MTEENDAPQRLLPRIREELERLPLTEERRDAFAKRLAGNAAFVKMYADRLASGELRENPLGFADKVQAVVDRFRDAEFTSDDYLKAVVRRPDILTVGPDAIARSINGVVDLFAADGLTAGDYLRAAVKQPSLFIQSPETLADNITGLAARFAAEGLSDRPYLNAALRHPSLFTLSPSTAEHNIRSVVERFRGDGMTTAGYLKAVLQTPALIAMSPETVSRHIHAVMDLSDRGVFTPSGRATGARAGMIGDRTHHAVIEFLLANPRLLTLADDNYGLREIHQRLTDGPTDRRVLETPRHAVERDLMRHLGHEAPDRPVETDGFVVGSAPPTEEQARRFVLRALTHAGFIRGGSRER